jgi:lipopolysaccharide transport system ATP-binding protein
MTRATPGAMARGGDVAISVMGLSKSYLLGRTTPRPTTLREALLERVRPRASGGSPSTFWALRDVSFEVGRGEVLGIIGRNGAGKSTLLKILSRITEPTDGEVRLNGRVGSLLEVGTGFHPELTGRENIFLNGAILGMRRREIRAQFDAIVEFAEVERFIDTPVKRYSSGMYVRLAFAVAAHLNTDILVVDEVLAVGDAAFQKRCLGTLGDVARSGRTVLFVSHNMGQIQRLCTRAIVLREGQVVQTGTAEECVRDYLAAAQTSTDGRADLTLPDVGRRGTGLARFTRAELLQMNGSPASEFCFGEPMRIRLHLHADVPLESVVLGFSFIAADGTELQGAAVHDGGLASDLEAGPGTFECVVDPMLLVPGRYYLRGAVFRRKGELYDHIDEMLSFDVLTVSADPDRTPASHYVGYVYLPYQWSRVALGGSRGTSGHRAGQQDIVSVATESPARQPTGRV